MEYWNNGMMEKPVDEGWVERMWNPPSPWAKPKEPFHRKATRRRTAMAGHPGSTEKKRSQKDETTNQKFSFYLFFSVASVSSLARRSLSA